MIKNRCVEGGKVFYEGFVKKFGKKASDGEVINNSVGVKGEGGGCNWDKASSVRKGGSTLSV